MKQIIGGLWCVLLLVSCNTVHSPENLPEHLQANIARGDGLNAVYFDNPDFTGASLKRSESTVNFAWGNGTPSPSIAPDMFSARFSGYVSAPSTGTYTFYATADDGVRLSVNGSVVLDDFAARPPRTVTGTATLTAGKQVSLSLEYFENFGGAQLRLEWSGPGVTRQVIPQANLFTAATVTTGQVFYVAANGSDSNPGTEAKPWATISKAAQTLTAGQTVLVKDGTYGGVYMDRSGAPRKPISFRAYPGAKPKIVITEINSAGFEIDGGSYIIIDGFDFDYKVPGVENTNGERWEPGITINVNTKGASPVLPHHVQVINNHVHGFPGGGIGSGLADYIRIEGNTIWETALWSYYDTSAISLYQNVDFDLASGFHNVIRGNTVFKNENRFPGIFSAEKPEDRIITDGNCIIIDDTRQTQKFLDDKTQYPAYKSSTLIENNICAGNGGRGVHVFLSDNVLVRHNTLYQNLQTPNMSGGELTAVGASNVRFVNNIVYTAPGQRATDVYSGDNPDLVTFDIFFENNLYFNTTYIPNKSPSDLIGDPLFVLPNTDVTTANFRLKVGSPAIDRALSTQSPKIDIGKFSRPKGKGTDIGAWESY